MPPFDSRAFAWCCSIRMSGEAHSSENKGGPKGRPTMPRESTNTKPTLWSPEWYALWEGKPEPKLGTDEYYEKWWGDFTRHTAQVDWPSDEWS